MNSHRGRRFCSKRCPRGVGGSNLYSPGHLTALRETLSRAGNWKGGYAIGVNEVFFSNEDENIPYQVWQGVLLRCEVFLPRLNFHHCKWPYNQFLDARSGQGGFGLAWSLSSRQMCLQRGQTFVGLNRNPKYRSILLLPTILTFIKCSPPALSLLRLHGLLVSSFQGSLMNPQQPLGSCLAGYALHPGRLPVLAINHVTL